MLIPTTVLTTTGGGSGLFDAFALLREEQTSGTQGGAATTGSWQTRTLNTEVTDDDSIVSLSSNQFTLQAGTYMVRARSPFYRTQGERIRLRNITDSTDVEYSENSASVTTVNAEGTVTAHLVVKFTISSAKTFEIQYQVTANDGGNTRCLGYASSFAAEYYSAVEIYRFGSG